MRFFKFFLAPLLTAFFSTACATSVRLPADAAASPALAGSWENLEQVKDENGTGWARDIYEFRADGSFTQNGAIEMTMSDEESVAELQISFKGGGRYGVVGDRIYFDFFPAEADASVQKFSFRAKDSSMSAEDEAKAMTVMRIILVNPIVRTMRRTMREGQIYRLDSVDGNRLVITNTRADDPEPQTFNKIK